MCVEIKKLSNKPVRGILMKGPGGTPCVVTIHFDCGETVVEMDAWAQDIAELECQGFKLEQYIDCFKPYEVSARPWAQTDLTGE